MKSSVKIYAALLGILGFVAQNQQVSDFLSGLVVNVIHNHPHLAVIGTVAAFVAHLFVHPADATPPSA